MTTIGLVGKKCGMTRVFTEDGSAIPVSVIEIIPNRVTQIKSVETDGYTAVQVTVGAKKRSKVSKPAAGHFAKANVEPGSEIKEFRIEDVKDLEGIQIGAELAISQFTEGQYIDVSGYTKGKGFAGAVKRHHFRTQDATHGNSLSHRAPGSIGQRQSPGKVFKGKKMCGHLGDAKRTILSQQIIRIDQARNLILVKGGIPGAINGYVFIRLAVKKSA